MANKRVNRNNQDDSRMFGSGFWKYSSWGLLFILLLCLLPFLFTLHGCDSFDFTESGQIGDTIGGSMSPFVAIFAAVLTFLAFWVQYKANEQQRKDIAIQRFENNLFQLIALQESITNNLSFSSHHDYNDLNVSGRSVFEFIYLQRRSNWKHGLRASIEFGGLDEIKNDKSLWCLDHYFRHLFQIYDYIQGYNEKFLSDKNKYDYACFVTGTLSEFELLVIFYHCLIVNDNDFSKSLIERFAVLKNLRFDLLATKNERDYYSLLVKNGNTPPGLVPSDNKLYIRKAFIHYPDDN